MDTSDVLRFLTERPDYRETLERIVEWEEESYKCKRCGDDELQEVEEQHFRCKKCGHEQYVLGLQWFDLSEPASRLNSLVYNKILRVSLRTGSGTHYLLVDREAVKEALRVYGTLREPILAPVEEKVEVPPDLFSVIEGYDGVKEVIKAGLNSPKPCHFLLVGSVSTAKSLFLEEVNRVKGSSYHLGSSSTKAGLSDFLFNARPRILLIDELDKMSREDYASLLSLMESGKVAETKYHRRREEHMDVWVFATANTLKGIPPENVSRFKPYIFHFREYTPEEYVRVVVKVLTEREGVDPDLAGYIASKLVGLTRDVRAARGLGRLCKTREEVDRHIEILKKYEGFKYV